MGSNKRKCCVPDCDDRISKRHRFPKDPELLNTWLENINNPALSGKTLQQLSENHRVCHRHFSEEFAYQGSTRGRDLAPYAYPTLFLPKTTIVTVDETLSTFRTILALMEEETSDNSRDVVENPKEVKPRRQSLLKDFQVTRKVQLPPNQQKMYKKVVAWSKKTVDMSRKIKNLKNRVKLAKTMNESSKFSKLKENVNESTYNFILSQIKNQRFHPKGRRYSLDKILALSLLKASGRGYKLLSKVFAMPSRASLVQLLSKMPFTPGINKKMFETLKEYGGKLADKDKFCVLMFDEMALQVNVQYNQKEDLIEGICSAGSPCKPFLANHVTVFLLKGIHKQWKQPLCYHFSSGPMQKTDLKDQITEIAIECLNSGFKVIATVCDQYCEQI